MKKIVFGILIGIILSGTLVCASIKIQSDEIGYKNGSVKDALDYLYDKANSSTNVSKFCKLEDGYMHLTVGAKYKCQLGANDKDENDELIYRYFYILTINNDSVDLIMDNLLSSSTLTWYNAMKYFTDNSEGINYKKNWVNVLNIDLPKAQAIADVLGRSSWKAAENNNTLFVDTLWLTEDSTNFWTRDCVINTPYAWYIAINKIDIGTVSYSQYNSVRPVITVLKDNLSS